MTIPSRRGPTYVEAYEERVFPLRRRVPALIRRSRPSFRSCPLQGDAKHTLAGVGCRLDTCADRLSRAVGAYFADGVSDKHRSFHLPRHTCPTSLLVGGANIRYRAEVFRHDTLEATKDLHEGLDRRARCTPRPSGGGKSAHKASPSEWWLLADLPLAESSSACFSITLAVAYPRP